MQEREVAVSKVSYLEVLGYHGLSAEDRSSFKEFFGNVYRLGITDLIIEQAMALKQQRRMSLHKSHPGACPEFKLSDVEVPSRRNR